MKLTAHQEPVRKMGSLKSFWIPSNTHRNGRPVLDSWEHKRLGFSPRFGKLVSEREAGEFREMLKEKEIALDGGG